MNRLRWNLEISVLNPNTPLAEEVACAYIRAGLVGRVACEAVSKEEKFLPDERLGHEVGQL